MDIRDYFLFFLYIILHFPKLLIEDLKPESIRKRREYREREKAKKRAKENLKRKAQMNVPDMKVKEIIITVNKYEQEKWQIYLEDPTNSKNYAVLTRYFELAKRKNRNAFPEEKLQQGDRIVFGPTERGHGWYIYNDRGEKITSIGVKNVQLENFSDSF